MTSALRWRSVGVLALAGLAGACGDRPTPAAVPIPAPLPARPVVEVEPAARHALRFLAERQGFDRDRWVRLTVVWQPAPQIEVHLDRTAPGPGDLVVEAEGLNCVLSRDQLPYLQGARVGWVETAEGAGFDVTFPNRDDRDRQAAADWLRVERGRRQGASPAPE